MIKKKMWVMFCLMVVSLFSLAAQAKTTASPDAKSLFGVELDVFNYSSFNIQVRERYMFPLNIYPHSNNSIVTDWFDNLYDVGFYYYTVYGTYYPVPNCPMGTFYSDAAVVIHDGYVNGYLVPVCG